MFSLVTGIYNLYKDVEKVKEKTQKLIQETKQYKNLENNIKKTIEYLEKAQKNFSSGGYIINGTSLQKNEIQNAIYLLKSSRNQISQIYNNLQCEKNNLEKEIKKLGG